MTITTSILLNGSRFRDDGPNDIDTDIDGDGLPNDEDWDDDNDGIPDYYDPDDGNCGIVDNDNSDQFSTFEWLLSRRWRHNRW